MTSWFWYGCITGEGESDEVKDRWCARVYDCGWSPVKRERRVFPDPVNDKEIYVAKDDQIMPKTMRSDEIQ